jgi:hypothetical protein
MHDDVEKMLETLAQCEERMCTLQENIATAESKRNLDGMANCWDFNNCRHGMNSTCISAVQKAGKRCWLVAGTYGVGKQRCALLKEIGSCRECGFYKIMHSAGQDEESKNINRISGK